jgi:hypothetical protein
MSREVIKIMVSSTVYGFEKDLRQLCAAIESYKTRQYEYQVLNSCIGSIYVAPGVSNTEACLRAVDDCDFFLGIILPRYGSGITHQEFTRAIQQDKPRGFLSQMIEKIGRGTIKMIEDCESKGYTIPKWQNNSGVTILTFNGITVTAKTDDTISDTISDTVSDTVSDTISDTVSDTISDTVKQRMAGIVRAVFNKPGMKSNEIARIFNMTEVTIRRDLQKISKLVEFVGSQKSGGYQLTVYLKEKINTELAIEQKLPETH